MSIHIGGSSCPDICQAEITYFLEHWTNSCSVTRSVARGRHSTSSKVARDSHIKRRPLDFTVVSTPTLVPLVCSDLKVWDRGHSEIETTIWGKLYTSFWESPELRTHYPCTAICTRWRRNVAHTDYWVHVREHTLLMHVVLCREIRKEYNTDDQIEVYQPLIDKQFDQPEC